MPGGLFSVALSRDHSLWDFPSALPYGARTFLPRPVAGSDDLPNSKLWFEVMGESCNDSSGRNTP